MNKFILGSFFVVLIAGLMPSCQKNADTPATNVSSDSTKTTTVGGVTSTYKDTITYTTNNVTITYSRTSQCYPSNEIFAFTATAPGMPSNAIYNWDFGDGHTNIGNSGVGNIYQVAGKYTVTLNITDANGKSLSKTTLSITAYGQQVTPHASFYAQIFDINYPNNYNFNANGSNVPRGSITNYAWVWGDGSYNSSATPDNIPHNFPSTPTDKTYPVQLIVTAQSGCKDTSIVPVSISATYSNISGDFDIKQVNPCTAEYFVFTSNAQNVPSNAVYSWYFADDPFGASGTLPTGNPIQHTFTYQNTYSVTMNISVNGKIIYTVNKPVTTLGQNIKPKALFFKNISYEDSTFVKWAMYSSANVAHGYITNYAWYMDNNLISSNTNDTYETYPFNKGISQVTHTITFIVTGNSGCQDTGKATITIPIYGKYTY